jgi:DNA-binding response OmpR family regulator
MSSTEHHSSAATRIVLVEDDLRLAELVSRYLETHGFQVTSIDRGDAVVAAVRRVRPDLVILDLGLPGQDGFSVCRQLRPIYEQPILILTARDNDGDQVLGLELGADDYVIKPVEPRVLMARLRQPLRPPRGPVGEHRRPIRATVEQRVRSARTSGQACRRGALAGEDLSGSLPP